MNLILNDYNVEVEMPVPKHYIYRITNTVNNKQYIGQTKDIKRRIEQHLSGAGSRPLLHDIVMGSLADFKFEVLQIFHMDVDIDEIEDTLIDRHNSLHPFGYNLRVNRSIEANGEQIDLNNIKVQCKFVFCKDEFRVFSVGEFTKARSYQILVNIHSSTETSSIRRKKMFKFRYLEIQIETDQIYVIGETYE